MIDAIDDHIQRAFIQLTDHQPVIETGNFSNQAFEGIVDEQERYDHVMAFYLAEQINLSRAAELLSLPALDLRMRFVRLNIPLRLGATSTEEVDEDIQNAIKLTHPET